MDYIITFTWGFVLYPFMEILWRGYTHPTMCFAGGICSFAVYLITKCLNVNIFLKALAGALIITFVELVFGVLFNIILKMNVWDYSGMTFNFMGQICAEYFLLWYIICVFLVYIYSKIVPVFCGT